MNSNEKLAVAEQFGVATEQVERDHLISHLLAFLSRDFGDRIHFIGGTALARTYLPDGRLSEDIDLIAVGDRKPIAAELDAALPCALARTHGRLTLDPALTSIPDTRAAILRRTDRENPTAVPSHPHRVANRASIIGPAVRRCPRRRVVGAHPSCLRRIQDRDVVRPACFPRPVGPLGARPDRRYRCRS